MPDTAVACPCAHYTIQSGGLSSAGKQTSEKAIDIFLHVITDTHTYMYI